jgi:hypothetical protein
MIHFYCFNKIKTILISDLPVDKVRVKYGYQYEVINSIKDKSVLDIIKARTLRQYKDYVLIEWEEKVKKTRRPATDETKLKMSQAKLGKRRDEETKKRISNTMKGKSNFEGKRHSWESKEKIGEKLMGNHNVRDTYWIHNPRTDKERRVKERHNLARDYQLGRDYYSTESMILSTKQRRINSL